MKKYVTYRFWDWVLCICMSVGLTVNIFSGFELTDKYSSNIVIVVFVTALAHVVFFLMALNKKTTITGIIIWFLAMVALVAYFQKYQPFMNDKTQSVQIFWIITVGIALLVFLATRTKVGLVLLFLCGNIVMAAAYFLEFPVQDAGYIVYLFSCFAACMYRVYVVKLKSAHTGKVRFHGYMLQSIILSLVGLLAAMSVFIGIIKPLQPPTEDLKLITRLQSMNVLQQIGLANVKSLTDFEKKSNETPNNNEIAKDNDQPQEESEETVETASGNAKEMQNDTSPKPTKEKKNVFAIRYNLYKNWIPYIITGILLLMVGSILLKKYLRKHWYKKVQALPRQDAVVNLYHYILRKFTIFKYKKPLELTPREFAVNVEQSLYKFDEGESSFSNLTEIYMRVAYGYQPVSEEEWQLCKGYYERFHKNVQKEIGRLKYLLRFYRL